MSGINIYHPNHKLVGLIHDYAIFDNRDLCGFDFSGMSLINASFVNCALQGARFRNANLSGALFLGSKLEVTDFRGAILHNTDFTKADISDAIFDENEKIRKGIILTEPMVGYKKCFVNGPCTISTTVVELEIPSGAIVFSINNGKCRTNRAKVKNIYSANRAYSSHKYFTYYVGDEINIKDFNLAYNLECAPGIHFFRTYEEAANYRLQRRFELMWGGIK